jgi:hypothetical protein
VSAAALGAYRQPDADRLLEIERARQADEAATRRVVAAMRDPLHDLREAGPALPGLLLAVSAIVLPWTLLHFRWPIVAVLGAAAREWLLRGAFFGGVLCALLGVGFGVADLAKRESSLASVMSVLFGACAPAWIADCVLGSYFLHWIV